MEEARRVLARLERIEALERTHALPDVLLAELRLLLAEADAWARVERAGSRAALEAVERCRKALREPGPMLESTSRTLLA